MIKKRILYLAFAGALLLAISACSSFTGRNLEPLDSPSRFAYEHVNRSRTVRGTTRGATRRGPITRANVPRPGKRQPPYTPEATQTPTRVIPHSNAHPQGRVITTPDLHDRYYGLTPQAKQPTPDMPGFNNHETTTRSQARNQDNHASQAVPASPAPTPATTSVSEAPPAQPVTAKQELSSHKTNFDSKDEARTTNITRASSSINGHVVQPGETFSYNKTVGPTIERRGYKEGTIYVQGEKKKGFGGGVCQVSTTLSIAADEAGLTITERHDHSLPVSYANEGEEAATSYGGIDFKFKNEKPFPVVIKSSVEGGTITVGIYQG